MVKLDKDKGGSLSLDEMLAEYGKDLPASMVEKQKAQFKAMDKNGDGKLDYDEVYDFCLLTVKKQKVAAQLLALDEEEDV